MDFINPKLGNYSDTAASYKDILTHICTENTINILEIINKMAKIKMPEQSILKGMKIMCVYKCRIKCTQYIQCEGFPPEKLF